MNPSRRDRIKPMAQINVVPYIDVMLVLLVIFMITAPLMNLGQIDLPSVGQSLSPPVDPLEVIIRKDASLAVRDHGNGVQERPVTHEKLVALIRSYQNKQGDRPVVIAADKDVRYEEVVRVMDLLHQAQIRKVGLLTKMR